MTPMSVIVTLHVATGAVALAAYWSAALLAKGSPRHRLAGRVFLLAMLAIVVTGVPMVARALSLGHPVTAAFLAYLLLLVAQGSWSGWRAIRDRRSPPRYFGPVFRALTGAIVLAGAAMVVLGLRVGQPVLAVFGGVGGLVGWGAMQARRRADRDPVWWLREHYGAMIGNGVAVHIAFFGIGLRRLLPGVDPQVLTLFAWFAPLAVAAVAGLWIGRRYGRAAAARGR
ncbi:hypothetical protein [Arenimonas composti]|uniref:DUF2306 domain-containing protein n=1 Tax=Arenimonas composti TR7-09 = DSM 18010 TaxID=1121013 RepID=A0A091BGN0_9GAMM|nr:hypothetical protein [Arenimonas composti]KFN50707.1 hypothetical protein P873_05970 [Arenimonas composti TR7-09 = DSM 18010]